MKRGQRLPPVDRPTLVQALQDAKLLWAEVFFGRAKNKEEALDLMTNEWRINYMPFADCPLCAYTNFSCKNCPYFLKYEKTCVATFEADDNPQEFARIIMLLGENDAQ